MLRRDVIVWSTKMNDGWNVSSNHSSLMGMYTHVRSPKWVIALGHQTCRKRIVNLWQQQLFIWNKLTRKVMSSMNTADRGWEECYLVKVRLWRGNKETPCWFYGQNCSLKLNLCTSFASKRLLQESPRLHLSYLCCCCCKQDPEFDTILKEKHSSSQCLYGDSSVKMHMNCCALPFKT